jgi:hypothetical protein
MQRRDLSFSRDEFSNKLTIDIDGPYFPLEKFQKALEHFLTILSELDRCISSTGDPVLEWSISSVRNESLHLTAEANLVSDDIELTRPSEVIFTFARGMELIQERPERPPIFSNKALRSAKAFSEMLNPENFAEIEFSTGNWRIQITRSIAANVDDLIEDFHKSYGAIEGTLVSISIANAQSFGIRDFLEERVIKCYFPDTLFEVARNALGKRVYVFGIIRQRTHGQKINIQVTELKVLPDPHELPSLKDIFRNIRGER